MRLACSYQTQEGKSAANVLLRHFLLKLIDGCTGCIFLGVIFLCFLYTDMQNARVLLQNDPGVAHVGLIYRKRNISLHAKLWILSDFLVPTCTSFQINHFSQFLVYMAEHPFSSSLEWGAPGALQDTEEDPQQCKDHWWWPLPAYSTRQDGTGQEHKEQRSCWCMADAHSSIPTSAGGALVPWERGQQWEKLEARTAAAPSSWAGFAMRSDHEDKGRKSS